MHDVYTFIPEQLTSDSARHAYSLVLHSAISCIFVCDVVLHMLPSMLCFMIDVSVSQKVIHWQVACSSN